ncbi:DNA replication/repair protein RecF [Ligilactobacillus pobuzihii]|uniref:DNA replication and repair protein RecF n=1 Tax=Ligilactobacillus pobuzihii TaxID=449659 RepID=A0A0R2L9T6_9LACO|nr:DNA replication/repair protein RecF [Ligilactobacillus pobuzihii]KRK10397.1 recombination protein F [Ligilactobacillus pobuzihii E100301 = KCTC 13174]KRN98600.1 recombination protein F [Ligilactobacillus pobuzihii]GEN47600.1 DNA replication and repair protein RecF [Ligilactobacillus pobuzihii]
MFLKKLHLKNFRNYEDTSLEFSPGINVLLGQNAQGKTNLLESIYVLATARSHRTANDHELIRFGNNDADIMGFVHRRADDLPLELELGKRGKKARVNHLEQAKLSQYIGQLNVILFAPEDLSLVKGSPNGRRRFIDMEFGQIAPRYLHDLTSYRGVLKQRNRYLKLLSARKTNDRVYLDVLSEQLASFGGSIIAQRQKFLDDLEKYAQELHLSITQRQEKLSFEYDSKLKNIAGYSEQELQQLMYQQLQEQYEKEIFQGTTLIGPHRDDIKFLINDKNVQTYGSQGQQRTTALSVKLAEIDVMKEQTGEYPLLLLDDVLSELDGQRQTHLLKTIQNKVQTFLTAPAMNDVARNLIKEPKIFTIKNGNVAETTAKGELLLKTITFYPHGYK